MLEADHFRAACIAARAYNTAEEALTRCERLLFFV